MCKLNALFYLNMCISICVSSYKKLNTLSKSFEMRCLEIFTVFIHYSFFKVELVISKFRCCAPYNLDFDDLIFADICQVPFITEDIDCMERK